MNANIDDLDVDQARAFLTTWIRQLQVARNKREHYQRIEAGLTQMIEGIGAIFPDLTVTPSDNASQPDHADKQTTAASRKRPHGMTSVDVVAAVVNDAPGDTWLTVLDVTREIRQRGWEPDAVDPEAAIRTALARATAQGKIESTRLDGRTKGYRRHFPVNAEVPAATGTSVSGPTNGSGGEAHALSQVDQDRHHRLVGWNDDDRDRTSVIGR